MLKKGAEIVKGASELKKSKSLEIIQDVTPKVLVTRKSYHGNSNLYAKTISEWDKVSIEKYKVKHKTAIEEKIYDFNKRLEKGQSIKNKTKYALRDSKAKAWDSYIESHSTIRMALEHDCFYDVISTDVDNVTIAFLPLSTSNSTVSCGLQQFNKIHLLTNYEKDFYITRILFHKTMTKSDFIAWEAKAKLWHQDKLLRKSLFDKIQQDLEVNSYSILKDTDLVKSNLEFFSKELPLLKFKFTDLEF